MTLDHLNVSSNRNALTCLDRFHLYLTYCCQSHKARNDALLTVTLCPKAKLSVKCGFDTRARKGGTFLKQTCRRLLVQACLEEQDWWKQSKVVDLRVWAQGFNVRAEEGLGWASHTASAHGRAVKTFCHFFCRWIL